MAGDWRWQLHTCDLNHHCFVQHGQHADQVSISQLARWVDAVCENGGQIGCHSVSMALQYSS